MNPRFLQIHTLASYPGALLNRDDVGFAKRLTFGGAVRTRISSQCLKRHWRTFEGKHAISELDLPETIRSRQTFQRLIVEPLIKEGVSPELAAAAAIRVRDHALGKNQDKADAKEAKEAKETKDAKGKQKAEGPAEVTTAQVVVLGTPEIAHLLELARTIASEAKDPKKVDDAAKKVLDKEAQKNLKALKMAGGVGAAMFGRMVTSDVLARGDAAVHVAHAITVHKEESETDYFSAIDDYVRDDGELGSGHIGNTELTSGLYYSYVVVDIPLLISNLEGTPAGDWLKADRTNAAALTARLIQLIATVSPGAKLGSTAPYSRALAMLVELGDEQPRTLANAFLQPVSAQKEGLLANSYRALGNHVAALDKMYGNDAARRFCGLDADPELLSTLGAAAGPTVPEMAAWVGEVIRTARVEKV